MELRSGLRLNPPGRKSGEAEESSLKVISPKNHLVEGSWMIAIPAARIISQDGHRKDRDYGSSICNGISPEESIRVPVICFENQRPVRCASDVCFEAQKPQESSFSNPLTDLKEHDVASLLHSENNEIGSCNLVALFAPMTPDKIKQSEAKHDLKVASQSAPFTYYKYKDSKDRQHLETRGLDALETSTILEPKKCKNGDRGDPVFFSEQTTASASTSMECCIQSFKNLENKVTKDADKIKFSSNPHFPISTDICQKTEVGNKLQARKAGENSPHGYDFVLTDTEPVSSKKWKQEDAFVQTNVPCFEGGHGKPGSTFVPHTGFRGIYSDLASDPSLRPEFQKYETEESKKIIHHQSPQQFRKEEHRPKVISDVIERNPKEMQSESLGTPENRYLKRYERRKSPNRYLKRYERKKATQFSESPLKVVGDTSVTTAKNVSRSAKRSLNFDAQISAEDNYGSSEWGHKYNTEFEHKASPDGSFSLFHASKVPGEVVALQNKPNLHPKNSDNTSIVLQSPKEHTRREQVDVHDTGRDKQIHVNGNNSIAHGFQFFQLPAMEIPKKKRSKRGNCSRSNDGKHQNAKVDLRSFNTGNLNLRVHLSHKMNKCTNDCNIQHTSFLPAVYRKKRTKIAHRVLTSTKKHATGDLWTWGRPETKKNMSTVHVWSSKLQLTSWIHGKLPSVQSPLLFSYHNPMPPTHNWRRDLHASKLLYWQHPVFSNMSLFHDLKLENIPVTIVAKGRLVQVPRKKRSPRKKRTKENVEVTMECINTGHFQCKNSLAGLEIVEFLILKMEHLSINCWSYKGSEVENHQQENALILYNGGGAMVQVESVFSSGNKKRPRPKVEIDSETNRAWTILLGKENIEGPQGSDTENEKWWGEERKVFQGRVDSFIARMHLVQGDRRFSPWKGSVVDSVVGVFLTQNVSDHKSSSAFMSLAARFPVHHKQQNQGHDSTQRMYLPYMVRKDGLIEHEDQFLWQHCICQKPILHKEQLNSNEKSQNDEQIETHTVNDMHVDENVDLDFNKGGSGFQSDMIAKKNVSILHAAEVVPTENEEGRSSEDGTSLFWNSEVSAAESSQVGLFSLSKSSAGGEPSMESGCDLLNVSTSRFLGSCCQWHGREATHELKPPLLAKENSLFPHSCRSSESKPPEQTNSHFVEEQYPTMQRVSPISSNTVSCGFEGSEFHRACMLGTPIFDLHCTSLNAMRTNVESSCAQKSTLFNNIAGRRVPEDMELSSQTEQAFYSSVERYKQVQTSREAHSMQISLENMKNPDPCPYSCDSNNHPIFLDHSMPRSLQNEIHQREFQCKIPKESTEVRSKELCQNQYNSSSDSQQCCSTSYSTKLFDLRIQEENSLRKEEISKTANHPSKSTKFPDRKKMTKSPSHINWENLRRQACGTGSGNERSEDRCDSVDWEAVRQAEVSEISDTLRGRGMNNVLAGRIKDFLNRLVEQHGSIDLEWLRDIPSDQAKDYLLSIRGLGLKSVECVRLLTLQQLAFPVDTNVGRICVRLGWVPLQPLPESLQLHLLELYPVLESIQRFLWPRLCKLDERTLYELHYQMITFGKVFCTKIKPNCNACPLRGECKHFASAFASARFALPAPEEKNPTSSSMSTMFKQDSKGQPLHELEGSLISELPRANYCEPIIEEPVTPEPEDMELLLENMAGYAFPEDPDEIPTIKLNIEKFTENLQTIVQECNTGLQEEDISKALVALTQESAYLPQPKLKHINRLRTEHQVYELPNSHPLLVGMDPREPDDPCPYLLAIWTPGETSDSMEAPKTCCSFQGTGTLCENTACFACNSIREERAHKVRGTLLIPCRTAMKGRFPLNGTYFQVNEVFADHCSSLNPVDVPRNWIWNLPRRTVYFGTSIPTIFRGMTTESIQYCFWRGFVCVRGFDRKTRAPRPLVARLHFPVSKAPGKQKIVLEQKLQSN